MLAGAAKALTASADEFLGLEGEANTPSPAPSTPSFVDVSCHNRA
jgi:hypothetical protein